MQSLKNIIFKSNKKIYIQDLYEILIKNEKLSREFSKSELKEICKLSWKSSDEDPLLVITLNTDGIADIQQRNPGLNVRTSIIASLAANGRQLMANHSLSILFAFDTVGDLMSGLQNTKRLYPWITRRPTNVQGAVQSHLTSGDWLVISKSDTKNPLVVDYQSYFHDMHQ